MKKNAKSFLTVLIALTVIASIVFPFNSATAGLTDLVAEKGIVANKSNGLAANKSNGLAAAAAEPVDVTENGRFPVDSTEWAFVDGLGRPSVTYGEAGAHNEKIVGMFYWTWHHQQSGTPEHKLRICNVHNMLKRYPSIIHDYYNLNWRGYEAYFWNEPLFGYYTEMDDYVLRKHAELLADAGVDFVLFDCTNGDLTWEDAYMNLLKVWSEARADGVKTPQVAFMLPFGSNTTDTNSSIKQIYNKIYKNHLYEDLWFKWEGKPLVMGNIGSLSNSYLNMTERTIRNFFTWRKGEPEYFGGDHDDSWWGWLHVYPQALYKNSNGSVEFTTVGVAQNADYTTMSLSAMNSGHNMGRGFSMQPGYNYTYNYRGQNIVCSSSMENAHYYGINFQEQWDFALSVDPEIVFVTGWNEWIMGRYEEWMGVANAFPDQCNDENSRDIEPSKGDLKDYFYYQLVNNVRKYKGMAAPAEVTDYTTVDITGDLSVWNGPEVREYLHYANNTYERDADGFWTYHYTNPGIRNDIIKAKVAYDAENVYFYAETVDPVTPYTDANWMRLIIDTENATATSVDWEDFEYIIGRTTGTANTLPLEKSTGGWNWQTVGNVSYNVRGNIMQVAVPRALLGLTDDCFRFNFKWADANLADGDILSLYSDGDAAPGGRFAFVFEGSDPAPPLEAVSNYSGDVSPTVDYWIRSNTEDRTIAFSFRTAVKAYGMELPRYWASALGPWEVYVNIYALNGGILGSVASGIPVASHTITTNGDSGAPYYFEFSRPIMPGEYAIAFTIKQDQNNAHYFVLPYANNGRDFFGPAYFEYLKVAGPNFNQSVNLPMIAFKMYFAENADAPDFFLPLSGREGLVSIGPSVLGNNTGSTPIEFINTAVLTPVIPDNKTLYSFTMIAAPTWSVSGVHSASADVYLWRGSLSASVSGGSLAHYVFNKRDDGVNLEVVLGNIMRSGNQYIIVFNESGQCGAWYNTASPSSDFRNAGFTMIINGTQQDTYSPRCSFRWADVSNDLPGALEIDAASASWISNTGSISTEGTFVRLTRSDPQGDAMWGIGSFTGAVDVSAYRYVRVEATMPADNGHVGFYYSSGDGNRKFSADMVYQAGLLGITFEIPTKYAGRWYEILLPLFGSSGGALIEKIIFFKTAGDAAEYVAAELVSAGIGLGDDITLNVTAKVPRTDSAVAARFTRDGISTVIAGTRGTDGTYKFSYAGIYAQMMTDEIQIELLLDGTAVDSSTFSVEQYAVTLYGLSTNTKLRNLLGYLLKYGAEAQLNKNYHTERLASGASFVSGITAYDNAAKPTGVKAAYGTTDGDFRITGAGAYLDNSFRMRFAYLAEPGGYITMAYEGGSAISFSVTDRGNGSYLALTDQGVKPVDYTDVIVVELHDANGNFVMGVRYNFEAYVASQWDSAEYGPVIQAMYRYFLAARALVT